MSNECILCVKPMLKYPSTAMSLHKFPSCLKKRKTWLNQCRLTNEEVLPNHKICSFHFEPTCFKPAVKRRKGRKERMLQPDAVPTIFNIGFDEITKGRSKSCNKNKIARHNIQSHDILPIKADKKVNAGQNPNILTSNAVKKKIFGQNSVSCDISPSKDYKKNFRTCYVLLTDFRKMAGHDRDISSTIRAADKVVANQNHQSRDNSSIEADKDEISNQNFKISNNYMRCIIL